MSLEWEQITVASRDPVALGRWWCEALGWVVVDDGPVVFVRLVERRPRSLRRRTSVPTGAGDGAVMMTAPTLFRRRSAAPVHDRIR